MHTEIKDIISTLLFVLIGSMVLGGLLGWIPRDTKLTMRNADTLINHDQRLIEIESHSGDIDALRKELHDSIYNGDSKNARIYNLEITICLFDKEKNEVHKRKVIMNNIIAINPSVQRTLLDTGLGYSGGIKIPTIMDSTEEYACGLTILSIK